MMMSAEYVSGKLGSGLVWRIGGGEIWGESEFYGALKEVARNPRTDWEVGGGLPCEAGGSG